MKNDEIVNRIENELKKSQMSRLSILDRKTRREISHLKDNIIKIFNMDSVYESQVQIDIFNLCLNSDNTLITLPKKIRSVLLEDKHVNYYQLIKILSADKTKQEIKKPVSVLYRNGEVGYFTEDDFDLIKDGLISNNVITSAQIRDKQGTRQLYLK